MAPPTILELFKLSDAFNGIITAAFGIVLWEAILCFVWFDWQIITGKVKIKWPISLYFINRMAGFVLIICTQLHLPPSNRWVSDINCYALDTLLKIALGAIAFCSAQVIVWRTWALLDSPKAWFWPCCLALLIQPALYSPVFLDYDLLDPVLRGTCAGKPTMAVRNGYYAASFGYIVGLYLVCLILTTRRLLQKDGSTLRSHLFVSKDESIVSRFIRSGIFYFIATLFVSLPIALSDLYSENVILELILSLFFAACDMILTGRQIIEWHNSNHRGASIFFVGGKRLRPMKQTDLRGIGISSMIVTHNEEGEEMSSDDDMDSLDSPELNTRSRHNGIYESEVDQDRILLAQAPKNEVKAVFEWDGGNGSNMTNSDPQRGAPPAGYYTVESGFMEDT